MKIISIQISGFLGRENTFEAILNQDLNILTGRNGAGKTSLLKLIWYIMSGNILLALQEVNFQRTVVKTDAYECAVTKLSNVTWPAPGSEDTELGVLMEPEVDHGASEIYTRVQA